MLSKEFMKAYQSGEDVCLQVNVRNSTNALKELDKLKNVKGCELVWCSGDKPSEYNPAKVNNCNTLLLISDNSMTYSLSIRSDSNYIKFDYNEMSDEICEDIVNGYDKLF